MCGGNLNDDSVLNNWFCGCICIRYKYFIWRFSEVSILKSWNWTDERSKLGFIENKRNYLFSLNTAVPIRSWPYAMHVFPQSLYSYATQQHFLNYFLVMPFRCFDDCLQMLTTLSCSLLNKLEVSWYASVIFIEFPSRKKAIWLRVVWCGV